MGSYFPGPLYVFAAWYNDTVMYQEINLTGSARVSARNRFTLETVTLT